MASGTGSFDKSGNPCLKFHLCGVAHDMPGIELEGIIDTGFTGFIQIPAHHAFSLKLPLDSTVSTTLADGSKVTNIMVLASTTYNGVTVTGAVNLSGSSQEILVGMDFLRQFHLSLIVAKGFVVLMREDWVQKIIDAEQKKQQDQIAAAPATTPVIGTTVTTPTTDSGASPTPTVPQPEAQD